MRRILLRRERRSIQPRRGARVAKPTFSSEANRLCVAVTREGNPCRNQATPGQPLCRVHAGDRGPPPAVDADSLYEEGIGEEERRLWDRISVTDLDAEIRIAKLQLKRLLAAQKRAELGAEDEAVEPSKLKTGKRMTAKARAIDYDDRVNRLLGRISDLVVTRAKLQRDADLKQKERDEAADADDPVERLARRIDRVAARMGANPDSGEPDSGGG